MSASFDTLVRVRYAETDKMGVVYYANYYIYFEIGRVEYMRNLGIDYKRMEIEDDSFIVVGESKCRYRRPARYDDLLRIRTRVLSVMAAGETIHVVCGTNGKPKALPEKYRSILANRVA